MLIRELLKLLKENSMKFKRRYEKWNTRYIPLIMAEYWHKGEYYSLLDLTEGKSHFNPLFIYQKGKGVTAFYDLNNPETAGEPLIEYFTDNPKKFDLLADEYEKQCRRLLTAAGKVKPDGFSGMYDSLVSFWAKFDSINVLSSALESDPGSRVFKRSYDLRKKWEKVEYTTRDMMVDITKKILPEVKEYADFLTFEEISTKNIPREKELHKRKEGYIYFEGILYADLAIEKLEKSANIEIVGYKNEIFSGSQKLIKGMAAVKGKARGRVRIIFGPDQISKIKKGDILVTPMTTPDYIAAMEKAAAFVTDEGGITCHAAITAREIGKPCLIGTKVATRILKDGDLAEVDADKGIVKILKRN